MRGRSGAAPTTRPQPVGRPPSKGLLWGPPGPCSHQASRSSRPVAALPHPVLLQLRHRLRPQQPLPGQLCCCWLCLHPFLQWVCACWPFKAVAVRISVLSQDLRVLDTTALSRLLGLLSTQTSMSTDSFRFQAWKPFATARFGCVSRCRGGSFAPCWVMLGGSQRARFLCLTTQGNDSYSHREA